jgi:hypothetical protein
MVIYQADSVWSGIRHTKTKSKYSMLNRQGQGLLACLPWVHRLFVHSSDNPDHCITVSTAPPVRPPGPRDTFLKYKTTLQVLFALSNSANSSSEVYFFIIGVSPINLPTKANVACIFHGSHQRSAPSHVVVGNHTIAVPETCLARVSF